VVLVEAESGWGAIGPQGHVLVDPVWEKLSDAGEGLVFARRGGVWGLLDPHAPTPPRAEPRFESPGHFHDGLASIELGRAYIDPSGREVWRRPGPRAPVLPPQRRRKANWPAAREVLARLASEPMTTRARVFGAGGLGGASEGGHAFILGPRLTEDDVSALEAKHRVKLPPELRSFVIEVGNGPAAPKASGGAGPGHGLYDIAARLARAPRAHEPFDPPRSLEAWRAAMDRDEESVPPGLIEIGTHGCAFDYGIVVTGPWAGTMWSYVDPGWIPDTTAWGEILNAHHDEHPLAYEWCWAHLDQIEAATFEDVYLDWLDFAEGHFGFV